MKTRIQLCEQCNGKIGIDFYIVKLSQAIVDVNAVNRHLGMTQHFQGNSTIAEVFSTDDTLEHVMHGEDANKWPEMVICQKCFVSSPILTMLFEKGSEATSK